MINKGLYKSVFMLLIYYQNLFSVLVVIFI
nr:MAG TPA: hypothetical protein [Caudoviricetes sp.]